MNWFLKLIGYKDRKYQGTEFSVRIKPVFREVLSVLYERGPVLLNLNGEYIGKEGIQVHIPEEFEITKAMQIAKDLETAFESMEYGYLIVRSTGTELVSENEQQAALAELRDMGYEIEISPDRKQITQKKLAGAPKQDIETLRQQTPRMMALIQSLRGKRARFETLAKSKEF